METAGLAAARSGRLAALRPGLHNTTCGFSYVSYSSFATLKLWYDIQFTDSFAVLLSVGVSDLRSSSLNVTRWALGAITGSNEHLQGDNLSPNTLSFHFPSEFREKGLVVGVRGCAILN